jgi:hypothetical protein
LIAASVLAIGGAATAVSSPASGERAAAAPTQTIFAPYDASGPLRLARPASASKTPRVTLFAAIPASVPPSGGSIRLLADVENASLCHVSSTRGSRFGVTRDCSSGDLSVKVTLARNRTAAAQTYGFTLSVSGRHGTKTTVPVVVRVLGRGRGHSAPRVTSAPRSASVTAGQLAGFSATASGNPTPSAQWQVSTNLGRSWHDIAGARATTYSLLTTASESGEEFRAAFTNSAGSATTAPATLIVTAAPVNAVPVITTQPASASVTSGAGVSFSAAASGTPAPSVQWQVSTNSGASWSAIAGATSTSYTLSTTSTSESGTEYEAVFANVAGSATTAAATLTVNVANPVAPAVTTNPTSHVWPSSGSVTLTAAASGNPAPSVQWQVSTNGGSTWGNIAGATSATYTFPASTAVSGDEYEAVFTNPSGSATSTAATVTVTSEAPSSNWSGYAVAGADDSFTSVSASWTVPTVTCAVGETDYSSQWIGIDGDASPTVEQDGSEADCSNGTPVYDAWYEMYGDDVSSLNYGAEVELCPSHSTQCPTGPYYPVVPGDAMSAHVSVSGTSWTLEIQDTTHAWNYSRTVTWSTPEEASAEWIIERPELGNNQLASLSDFGTAGFTSMDATQTTSQTAAALGAGPLAMTSSSSNDYVLSLPGALGNTGDSFTATWLASS